MRPVARFGTTKTAVPYLLLSLEQRRKIADVVPDIDSRSTRLASDPDRYAVLRPNGASMRWWNAENLWVAVPWILALPTPTQHTYGSGLVFRLAQIVGDTL